MAGRQRLIPSRREYNPWVADEKLEDFALRYTPASARRWRGRLIANTALGSSSFMALEAIGGLITLRYGFAIASVAIIATSFIIFCTALPIAVAAARRGIDLDLLTRGAGFGYIGSTITSLIYAAFIFFALEATILASALAACVGLPMQIGCLLSAVAIVPMVTLGISFISRFQRATQPFWLLLTLLPLGAALSPALAGPAPLAAWRHFPGLERSDSALLDFGATASIIAALLAQVGEQVNYLRFPPAPTPGRSKRWWAAVWLCY